MKLVLIAYNEALDDEVGKVLAAAGAEGWTKWARVYGKGRSSGPHLGTHVWPKANDVLAVVTDEDTARKVLDGIRELRTRLAREGVKAFLLPCEEVT
ncbi:MAG: hypothetical protein GXY85_04825 [Candidatus Brocadiaceae bacterium]|nr:hypothetical protein [Candidatus Brocadiaceae bacterium]